jgi:N-formylglutamate amidohydrolase
MVSVPHDGWQIPSDILQHMTGAGRGIPDTDWHVSELYGFARDMGASMIVANYSRYVVDLNRPPDDAPMYAGQLATGLCPTQTFAGDDIYFEDADIDIDRRKRTYWQPYHDGVAEALAALREEHGYALLWDAHSIPSQVPSLFEGELPVLNLGTWDDRSCDSRIADAVMAAATSSPYDAVYNGRFKGGYITRNYGHPAEGVHAIQLELAQRAYMDERKLDFDRHRAADLQAILAVLLEVFMEAAAAETARR